VSLKSELQNSRLFFHRLREIIAEEESNEGMAFGEFEVDESYFSGKRKGKRGREPKARYLFLGSLKEAAGIHTGHFQREEHDLDADHSKDSSAGQHRFFRHATQLQCAGCLGFQRLQDQPFKTVCRQAEPHQWN